MTKLKELKKRFMEDPEFREAYALVDEEYALVEALVRARTAAKLTQAEVARRLGTTQSAVARLEGGRVSPSFATLRRYAEATGTRLTVGLVRPTAETHESTRQAGTALAGIGHDGLRRVRRSAHRSESDRLRNAYGTKSGVTELRQSGRDIM